MSRLLIDTHVFLWWLDDSTKLSRNGRCMVRDADEVHVSIATIWEIAIKCATGKLKVDWDIEEELVLNDFIPISISIKHALFVKDLPLLHQDPFDRLLVSQAKQEGLTLVTHDKILQKYDIDVVVV